MTKLLIVLLACAFGTVALAQVSGTAPAAAQKPATSANVQAAPPSKAAADAPKASSASSKAAVKSTDKKTSKKSKKKSKKKPADSTAAK